MRLNHRFSRGSCYGGIPRNVRRHATLWHLRNGDEGEMVLVDPSPPVLSFADYQPVGASSFQPPQSWLLTVVSSLIPDDAQRDFVRLVERFDSALNALRAMMSRDGTDNVDLQETQEQQNADDGHPADHQH